MKNHVQRPGLVHVNQKCWPAEPVQVQGRHHIFCALLPVILAGWVTPCRVQPVHIYFCASKTQQHLSAEGAMLLHPSWGCRSIFTCSCRIRLRQEQICCVCKLPAQLLWKHISCKQVPWALPWHCCGHTSQNMSDLSGFKQGSCPGTRSIQHHGTAGPVTRAAEPPAHCTPRARVLHPDGATSGPSHVLLPKQRFCPLLLITWCQESSGEWGSSCPIHSPQPSQRSCAIGFVLVCL